MDTISPPTESEPSRPKGRGARRVRAAVLLVLAVLAGVAVVIFVMPRFLRPHRYTGTVFPSAQPAPSLDGLVTDQGEPMDLADHRGEFVLLYFGYMSCPDVCPTSLSVAATAVDSLGDDGEKVKLFMVSVDPARDSLDDLGTYVDHFDESFAGLGADEQVIADVAALHGVFYQLQEPDEYGEYAVDHTASLRGIDADGNLKIVWAPDVTAEELAADLAELV